MAPPVDPPASITLRVKVPPGHVPGSADEFTLGSDVPVASKIGQIRERIQEAIPSSPTPERQRLLYGGRALVDNDQTLADALNIRRDPSQTEYVIHLLVKGEGASTAPVPHRTGMRTPARAGSPAAATHAANVPPTPAPQPAQAPNVAAMPDPHVLHERMHQDALRQHTQQIRQQQMQHQAAIAQQMQQQMMQFPQQPGFMPQPMMPFQMHHFAGHIPGLPFPQAHGFPMQPGLVQRQQQVVHGNGEQQPNVAPRNTSEQQPFPHHPEGQADQSNQGQTSIQLPTRTSTHQTPQGHDVQVRIQSTLRIPNQNPQAQQRQLGTTALPQRVQTPGISSPQGNANGLSALDRARENVAEMRRLINEMRSVDNITEPQRAQIRSLEERTQSLNDYIDPFRVGNVGSIGNNRARSDSPTPNIHIPPHMRLPTVMPLDAQPNWQQRAQQIRQTQHQPPGTSSTHVTCYLLSSPTGPHAILHSPQHGLYTGSMLQPASTRLQATPTTTTPVAGPDQANQQVVQGQAPVGQQVQAQAAQPDQLGPLGPIMGHVWLLIRVLIFSYFLLGANMGWRRPLALFAIGMGFWMIRMGLLGDGSALRRWWDGIMNDGRAPPAQQQGQQGQDQNQQEANQQQQPPAGDNARPGQMPTPEQLARRLLDEDARARDQARDQRVQWLRERIRPVERAVALLVASLWPGVGEAYVRAREQEERQRAEEEIAARRREEEERQKKEEEEEQKAEEGAQSDDKNAVPPDTAPEASAAGASNEAGSGVATESEKTGGAA